MPPSGPPAPRFSLSARGIEKSFRPGRRVLDGVDFEVREGEIHALLGENGAGKSTLMNVLVGLVSPERGALSLAGEAVELPHYGPQRAAGLGIAMVHQHSTLVGAMTVEENLCFGDPRGGFAFQPLRARARLERLCERFGLEVPGGTRVEELSVGGRQRAELLRALDRGARVLILDEPTAALTPTETEALFPALRRLRESGRAIIFISHKLDEVEALADRITVMRRGRCVATAEARELSASELGRLMLGRDLPALRRPPAVAPSERSAEAAAPLLALRGLCAPGLREASRLRSCSLELRSGEILGVAGIDGNGQRELEEVLVGVRGIETGSFEVAGHALTPEPSRLRELGVRHLSGDRERAGLVAGFSLAENWILKTSYGDRRFFPHGLLDAAAARAAASEAIERFDIVPPDPDADIATFSGGNAQKLAVARELDGGPRVLIALNPTRGLDVGAARFVHESLLALRARGGGVLLVSTELDEVLSLSDRLLALVRGELLPVPAGSDRAQIGAILLGRRSTEARAAAPGAAP